MDQCKKSKEVLCASAQTAMPHLLNPSGCAPTALKVEIAGELVPAAGLNWRLVLPGSVCEYKGKLYRLNANSELVLIN